MYYQTFSTQDGFDVCLYVPGYDRSNITVTRQGNYVVIEGKSEDQYAFDSGFSYKFRLADRTSEVDPELKNGVLIIHVNTNSGVPDTQQLTIR